MIKRLICKIGGCSCRASEDFTLDIDMTKRIFTQPEFYCTVCMGKLGVTIVSEEMIPDLINQVKV